MAWGRHAPHSVETERPGGQLRAVADTERLGIDSDVADRPAHAWEVDEAESWEPAVPDTWDPPTEADDEAASTDEAAWSDADRGQDEWATAGADVSEEATAGQAPQAVPPPDREARPLGQPVDAAAPPERATRADASTRGAQPPLTRMALGLASLAAQRMRGGVPAGDGLVVGFGVLRHTANGLVALGERLVRPASRVASTAVKGAATLPVVGRPIRVGLRSQRWLATSMAQARQRLARLASMPPGPAPTDAAQSRPAQPFMDAAGPAEQL